MKKFTVLNPHTENTTGGISALTFHGKGFNLATTLGAPQYGETFRNVCTKMKYQVE